MAPTFDATIAPLDAGSFIDPERRGRLPIMHGKCANRIGDVFGWDRFFDIAAHHYRPDGVRVTLDRTRIPTLLHQTDGRTDPEKLTRLLKRGASITLVHLHRYDAKLAAIAGDFASRGGRPIWIASIVSTGEAGSLKRHSDQVDILILQVEGAKRWRFYGPAGEQQRQSDDAQPAPIFDKIVEEGDYLFVPKGCEHECDNASDRSLHLGLGFARAEYDMWGSGAPPG